jgi:hypothetical protein
MPQNRLFTGTSVLDVVEHQKAAAKEEIQRLESNYLLNASETDLVTWLVDKFRFEAPVLDENGIRVADPEEIQVDVRNDSRRYIPDRSRPFFVPGTRVTIAIPFEGDASFFNIRPQTYSMSPPSGQIEGNELHLIYEGTDLTPEALKQEYGSALNQVRTHLNSLRGAAAAFNAELEKLVRQHIATRKQKLLVDAGLVASLGLPIRRREGAPTTYSVPMERHRARIVRPQPSADRFAPEPALAPEEFETIVSILRSMVAVMERSPSAFETMDEEDLRTHFLVQLNGQYDGQATAETFNAAGKTDILLRVEGRNVFIAECKVWRGPKQLLQAIDQLLSYLSWRDTKAAILVFNRNANFTEVLSAIAEAVPKHPCFKRSLRRTEESTFPFVFHQSNDRNREVFLNVMAFDVPTRRNEPSTEPASPPLS